MPAQSAARTITRLALLASATLLALMTLGPRAAHAQAIATAQAMVTGTARALGTTGPAATATATPRRATLSPSPTTLSATTTRPASPVSPTSTPRATPSAARSPTPGATPTATATRPSVPTATSFPYAPGALAGQKIMIDPGHGAPDPGAAYNGLFESNVNLAISQQLRTVLAAAGADAQLTRSTDQALAPDGDRVNVDADLQARVDAANQSGVDLFVSVHSNVGSDPSVQGAVTFYGPEGGYASGAQRTPRQVAASQQLAAAVERELTVATGAPNRGVRQANFWVLGGTHMPAILVETGYLTSPEEAARLGSPAYQRRVADGIAAGVARFLATENDAEFVADVTLPDGAQVLPGTRVSKTWRLRNTGASTWGLGYQLDFDSGDQLGGPDSVGLSGPPVPPGAEVDVSVPLQAPTQDTADPVSGRWQLQAPDGTRFGDRVWVSLQARTVLPTDRALPAAGPEVRYFDETGHNVGFAFRRFFETYGGLDRFGYPRTEELQEGGWTVQYFQRARFEYHPEAAGTPFEVQLTLLGDDATAGRRPFPAGAPIPDSGDHHYFPETGHSVHYAFWRYFREHGGLDSFGYPISEELYGENGWPYAVQYFQRARLEYHPEFAGTPYEVELGLLGDDALRQRGWMR